MTTTSTGRVVLNGQTLFHYEVTRRSAFRFWHTVRPVDYDAAVAAITAAGDRAARNATPRGGGWIDLPPLFHVEASNACLDCDRTFATAVDVVDHVRTAHTEAGRDARLIAALDAAFVLPQSG